MNHLGSVMYLETLGSEIEEMDRISQLPESLVHHILSCLDTLNEPLLDLARMSVMSKTWFRLTASFPILDFNIHNFGSRQSFFKYLDFATSRFSHHNVPAQEFNLITTLHEPAELAIVNRCLELLLNKGVQVLWIDIINSSEGDSDSASMPKYRLPNILLSVSVLKSLSIHGCDLPSSLMFDVVRFKSLTELRLVNVQIDDEVIKRLTTSCPLLQLFLISKCPGFKNVCVYRHENLRRVCIYCNLPVERIDIEAPNLTNITVEDREGRGAPQMSLASCKKLTTVTYVGHPLPNSNGFTDFLSNFPFIKNLVLATEYECNNLKFSSRSLRTLMVHANCDLEDIEFNTPNLVLFINSDVLQPLVKDIVLPLARHSAHLKPCMQCYPDEYIDDLWFQKLRLLLDKKNGFKVLNLYIHTVHDLEFIELEKLKEIELPPYELEHVELHLDTLQESSDIVAFVDAVLWCCCPRSLTLRSSFPFIVFEEQSDVVDFTYKKLLQQEDQVNTKIQIVSPSSSEARKQFRDFKSVSMALPCEGEAITFIKEEGTLFNQLFLLTHSLPHLLIFKQLFKKKQDNGTVKGMRIWRFSDVLDLGVLLVTKD